MNIPITRRAAIVSGLSTAALLAASNGALAGLTPTPRQTRGPFYPVNFPLDSDNDLVRVKGRAARAMGDVAHLMGRVLDTQGKPVPGARVEIWQCDAGGVYHHPGDGGRPDEDFQAYGRTLAGKDGAYRFRTIRPVPYPGRAPHIHIAVRAGGFDALATQLYIAGHPLNERDFIYRRAVSRGGTIVAKFRPAPSIEKGALLAPFDIVLGG